MNMIIGKAVFSSRGVACKYKKWIKQPANVLYLNLHLQTFFFSMKSLENEISQPGNNISSNILFKRKRVKTDFTCFYRFIKDTHTAGFVVKSILNLTERVKEKTFLEINPGTGLITEHLLKNGIPKLIIYDKYYMEPLKKITHKYEHAVQVKRSELFCHDLFFNMKFIYSEVTNFPGENIVIVGMCPNKSFLKALVCLILYDKSFGENVEFYFTLPREIYEAIWTTRSRYWSTVLYALIPLLMDVSVIGNLHRRNFYPPSSNFSYHYFYLMKMVKKSCNNIPNVDLEMYYYFLNLISRRKHSSAIKLMETIWPGAGPHLIANGLPPDLRLHTLSPDDIFSIYKLCLDYGGLGILPYVYDYYMESNPLR